MKAPRRMAAAEFDAVRPLLGHISPERVEAARLSLVAGQTMQSIGEQYGWSRQAVGESVDAVWRVAERYQDAQRAATRAAVLMPPGWDQVTLIAPKAMIARFREEIAQLPPVEMGHAEQKAAGAKRRRAPVKGKGV